MEPCKTYDPKLSYRFAIEANLGWFEKNKIKVGDYVKFD